MTSERAIELTGIVHHAGESLPLAEGGVVVAGMEDPGDRSETRLSIVADVSQLGLADLVHAPDNSVLDNSVRRLAEQAKRAQEAISGWSSYVD